MITPLLALLTVGLCLCIATPFGDAPSDDYAESEEPSSSNDDEHQEILIDSISKLDENDERQDDQDINSKEAIISIDSAEAELVHLLDNQESNLTGLLDSEGQRETSQILFVDENQNPLSTQDVLNHLSLSEGVNDDNTDLFWGERHIATIIDKPLGDLLYQTKWIGNFSPDSKFGL